MYKDKFNRRFAELAEAFKNIRYTRSNYDSSVYVSDGAWKGWGTSVQSLILAVFGENSPQHKNFKQSYDDCRGADHDVRELGNIFTSIKEDYEGGYVFNVDLEISGEVFGDFIGLAKEALSNGHKEVAAVLACASLEDALKRFASFNGLDVDQKSMQQVVSALKGKGLVKGAQKSLLDAMPRIRNMALHADWEKLTDADVASVIGFVEQFLLSAFSES